MSDLKTLKDMSALTDGITNERIAIDIQTLKQDFVYRRQQETSEVYEIEAQDQKEFQIETWTHKGFDVPRIWRNWWCKNHKTIAFSVYVPSQTNFIEFNSLSTFGIRFDKEDLE